MVGVATDAATTAAAGSVLLRTLYAAAMSRRTNPPTAFRSRQGQKG